MLQVAKFDLTDAKLLNLQTLFRKNQFREYTDLYKYPVGFAESKKSQATHLLKEPNMHGYLAKQTSEQNVQILIQHLLMDVEICRTYKPYIDLCNLL